MALFRVFKGTEDDLKAVPCHIGYVYLTELEKDGTGGNLYIDIGNNPEDRILVNSKYADALRKRKDGKLLEIDIDDLLLKDMINTALEGSVILSGNAETGLKDVRGIGAFYALAEGAPTFGNLPIEAGGTNADNVIEARENLSVYSKQEVRDLVYAATTVAYTYTIAADSWLVAEGNKFTSFYENKALRCGAGPNGDVPPTITYTSNFEEYSKIESAWGERGKGITFTTATKPVNDIGIIIKDEG